MMRAMFVIEDGERLPWWAGFCWHDHCRRQTVCAPLVLNLLLRFGLAFGVWLMHPVRFFDAAYEAEYWRRRARGVRYEFYRCPECQHVIEVKECSPKVQHNESPLFHKGVSP